MDEQKYPIGKFKKPTSISKEHIEKWIKIIECFPKNLQVEVQNLNDSELKKQYRPNGWTIKQVVNHCADSHMNSFIRFKLALTEETPTIKPYVESLWAEFPDSYDCPISDSLKIVEGLHARWVNMLKNMDENDLEKEFLHPETNEKTSLKINIGIYAWHCEHHLAHIKKINRKQ
jgi:hypothetical protein